jgi:hypothetical protein
MPPLRLSDSELDAVMAAARPLDVDLRDSFLQAVAHALHGQEIGPGLVARTCAELQRQFFNPPVETEKIAPRHDRTRVGSAIGANSKRAARV